MSFCPEPPPSASPTPCPITADGYTEVQQIRSEASTNSSRADPMLHVPAAEESLQPVVPAEFASVDLPTSPTRQRQTSNDSASAGSLRSSRSSSDSSPIRLPSPGRDGGLRPELKSPTKVSLTPLSRVSCFIAAKMRQLSKSWHFSALTMVLTIYALFGDDFRLTATHKRLDVMFDVLTIFCILVFCIEIVASSIGQDAYFLGFFFLLDVLSTATLFMDLSWISNAVFCSSVEGGGELRTARAGRAGARAGRTVRIIRLIRLAKLYKTYKAAIEKKEQDKRSSSASRENLAPGRSEWGLDEDEIDEREEEDDDEEDDTSKNAETRVGKKLSDMTTRRVIILVLVMLFAMPQFITSSHGFVDFRNSANMGMEMVYERWRNWCPLNSTHAEIPWCLQWDAAFLDERVISSRAEERWWYEHHILTYLYSHGDTHGFAWKLHWIGLNSTTLVNEFQRKENLPRPAAVNKALRHLQTLSQLGHTRFLKQHLVQSDLWNGRFANERWQIPVQSLPSDIRQQVAGVWEQQCLRYFIGVPLTASLAGKDQSLCSIDEDLRCSEFEYFIPLGLSSEEDKHVRMIFVFDKRRETQLEAGLSMLQTIFICLAVGFGAMTFSNDANKLFLKPIERMVAKMQIIGDNPLEAMRLGDSEWRREEIEAARRKEALARKGSLGRLYAQATQGKKIKEPMETLILEKTIIKLGGLLALGFGEAGAEIIGQNMRAGASSGVDAMVPGKKVDAIIGFCNIRHFTEATEVLKEKVMLFVNQVGEIVHGCVDDYHGAPNKNIGDAFLLVWRLSGVPPDRQKKLADMSLLSFTRIIAAINKSPLLAEYRGHPGMLQRVQRYRVEMGFGLHCGWAIEGAIGSEFKIDASYLSPNVNVSSRLEAATEQFGVWLLMSHFMISLCSKEVGQLCRLIDHVTVKGSKQPTRLYTLDVDYMQLEVHESSDNCIQNRFKVRQAREHRKNDKWSEEFEVAQVFTTDEDLVAMRRLYTCDFFQRFAMAYRNYEAGEWMVARDMFYTCHYNPKSGTGNRSASTVTEADWPSDGPTVTLLKFMRREGYLAPPDWPGHRALVEK